jgi:hypothetical protein
MRLLQTVRPPRRTLGSTEAAGEASYSREVVPPATVSVPALPNPLDPPLPLLMRSPRSLASPAPTESGATAIAIGIGLRSK